MTEEPKVSKVPPYLIAALICDAGVMDPSTGKKSLIGIFDRLIGRQFPTERAMSLYFKVTDAEGTYALAVDFVLLNSDAPTGDTLLARVEGELQAKSRTESVEALLPLPGLLFPKAGRYEFRISANEMYLGCASFDAVQAGATP